MKTVSNYVDKENGIIFSRVVYLEENDTKGLNTIPGVECPRYLATDIMLEDGASIYDYNHASHTPECKIFRMCNTLEEAKTAIVSSMRDSIILQARTSVYHLLSNFNKTSREDTALVLVGVHHILSSDEKYYFQED